MFGPEGERPPPREPQRAVVYSKLDAGATRKLRVYHEPPIETETDEGNDPEHKSERGDKVDDVKDRQQDSGCDVNITDVNKSAGNTGHEVDMADVNQGEHNSEREGENGQEDSFV